MEAKWPSLVSYGLSLDALQDFLPIDLSLDVKTVRYDTLKVAKRLEAELGENQASFIEGDPVDWDLLPLPDGSFKRFGFMQTLDTKSKRRLYEVLHSQDLQLNQEITFLSW